LLYINIVKPSSVLIPFFNISKRFSN